MCGQIGALSWWYAFCFICEKVKCILKKSGCTDQIPIRRCVIKHPTMSYREPTVCQVLPEAPGNKKPSGSCSPGPERRRWTIM